MVESSDLAPAEYRDRISSDQSWSQIVAWVKDLPPLPHVASQAIALVEDPNVTAARLTSLLQQDPALAARVLKIANSAMFSAQRSITTLGQAIMIIGFKTLKGVIVAATLRQLNRNFGAVERTVWENSTATATASLHIAQHLRASYAEEAFLNGLLHDLGKLVLLRQVRDKYKNVLAAVLQGVPFYEAEEKELGFTHSLIGALVAQKWNFSQDTCQVILHHHDPLPSPITEEIYRKTAIVQAGNYLAHALNYGHFKTYPDMQPEFTKTMSQLNIDPDNTMRLVEKIREDIASSNMNTE